MAHPHSTPSAPALLTREEICRELGISRSSSYRLERNGYLPPPLVIGPRTIRWRRADLEVLLERAAADRGGTP